MDNGIVCTLSKFAYDTQLCDTVNTLEGRDATQRCLSRCLRGGPVQNLMKFNKGQVQGPAPGSGQSQAQIQAGWIMD